MEFAFLYMGERITLLSTSKCSSRTYTYFRILLIVFCLNRYSYAFLYNKILQFTSISTTTTSTTLTPYEQNRD